MSGETISVEQIKGFISGELNKLDTFVRFQDKLVKKELMEKINKLEERIKALENVNSPSPPQVEEPVNVAIPSSYKDPLHYGGKIDRKQDFDNIKLF
jgi:hypothetical protein